MIKKVCVYIFLLFVSACNADTAHLHDKNGKEISYYTCAMHPQIHKDEPGNCPICGMKLVPVYKEDGQTSGSSNENGAKQPTINIPTQRQQLIGLTKEVVTIQKPTISLKTSGRVAFDPELDIAIKEFKEISQNIPSLKQASISRLKLMGLSDEEISDLIKSNKSISGLVLPQTAGPFWIYATLFDRDLSLITPGTIATISSSTGQNLNYEGVVRSIDRILDPATRQAKARIEVTGVAIPPRPDTFFDVTFNVTLQEGIVISKSAVLDSGNTKHVFVIKDDTQFETREVKTGPDVGDNQVIITEGLQNGETIVKSGTFLVDSESELKAAISGF